MIDSPPQMRIGPESRAPRWLLQVIQCAAVIWATVLVALIAFPRGVDQVTIMSPSSMVWVHLGRGKLACFVLSETGQWSFRRDHGWNVFDTNEPSSYFHSK
jgi:hypothetical protein